ncbi:Phage integrase family protein [Bremerella volcania]|uniref:Phage integrase family protein n=1 Tax=Bremerella volcania TaxID=2527984 RepID=A0A518C7A8_9BACT|nr:tyrosine-type recombinase/integrase [Bremerella volcania]QDU75109.1 Phage integrase family protein [Bremerella volcania]
MAKDAKLRWHDDPKRAAGGRWKKKYKGKTFYFGEVSSKSDKDGYLRACEAFEIWRAKIDLGLDASKPHQAEYLQEIQFRQQALEILDLEPSSKAEWERPLLQDELAQLQKELKKAKPEKPQTMHRYRRESWKSKIEVLEKHKEYSGKRTMKTETVQHHVDEFLETQRNRVGAGLKPGSFKSINDRLPHFANQFGSLNVDEINGRTLANFQSWLHAQMGSGRFSSRFADQILKQAIGFVKHLYRTEVIDQLPRNIDTLRIEVEDPDIEIFTKEEIKTLLEGPGAERTKLYLLLMLNCGYYASDLSELRQDEVDWNEGRIKRKRTKTRKHKQVPETDFKLWDKTFELLKKYRSSDKEWALTNDEGRQLVRRAVTDDGKVSTTNNVTKAYERFTKRTKVEKPKALMLLRKTAATELAKKHKDCVDYFLGHAPTKLSDKRYVIPDHADFDLAVKWLGEQFEQKTDR